jgi:hypothetical protein
MVIRERDLKGIILVYRIFTLYYKFEIDTVFKFRTLVRAINIQHLKSWCGLVVEDDLVLIDDEVFDLCLKSIQNRPILIGDPEEEYDDLKWGEWGETSKVDKITFDIVSKTKWWEGVTQEDILKTSWIDFLHPDEVPYFLETRENKFVFWLREEYDRYHSEIDLKRKMELRDLKLDYLI